MEAYSQYLRTIEWPAARFRFEFEAKNSIHFPLYAGSMLRGVFGHALRSVSCMTKMKSCDGCPLLTNCPYSRLFEPFPNNTDGCEKFSSVSAGYVFEPLTWGVQTLSAGDSFSFDMVLFGQEIDLLPLVIFALQKGVLRGIGHGEGTLRAVYQISANEMKKIFGEETTELKSFTKSFALRRTFQSSAVLSVETPARIQRDGRILNSDELTAKDFFSSLFRRVDLVCRTHAKPIEIPYSELSEQVSQVKMRKTLTVKDWVRYSNRQKKLMRLPGLVGQITFDNLSEPLFRFLEVGEYFHLGKNAAFGLGKIKLL